MQAQSECLIHALGVHGTDDTAPVRRRLEWDLPELTKAMVQSISQLETAGRLDYLAIRLRRVTPTLKLLCGLSSLRSLDLSHTKMTYEDLSRLERCHNLVHLDVSFCPGVTNLSLITHIKNLEVLKLSRCLDFIGVRYLGSIPNLKELELSETLIKDEDVRLLSRCQSLVKIDLSGCKSLTNVNPLSSIPSLEVIDLLGCTSLTHVGDLGGLPVLKEVDLSETRITGEDVHLLSECQSLVKMDLSNCEALTNVDPLSCIATLEEIGLSECTSLIRVGELSKLPVLKDIDLSGTRVKDREVYSLDSLRQQLGLPSICLRR